MRRAPTRTSLHKRRHETGLTVVELMVTMLLAGMLLAGLFHMMVGQTSTYRTQIAAVSVQENLWGAVEYVQRQVRMAGFGFAPNCPGGQVMQWNGNSGGGCGQVPAFSAFRVFNDCNLLTTSPDSCPDGSGSDSFVVTSATGGSDGATLAQRVVASAGPLRLTSPGGIRADDLLVLSGQGNDWCTIVRATSDPLRSGNEFEVALDAATPYNAGAACNVFPTAGPGYAARAMVARFDPTQGPRYVAIDRSKGAPRLVTWSTYGDPSTDTASMEVVANYIEDMQLAFACDDNTDGTLWEGADAGERATDEWALNRVGGDTTPPTCNPAPIRFVRVSLVARAASADPSLKNSVRPGLEDRPPGTVAEDLALSGGLGTFPRRSMTTLVRPRNL